MTFLTKAALISKIEKNTYEATESGKKYLISHLSGSRKLGQVEC